MNYFEHHIGDYDQATAHLTACEDGIYSRLIRWYMASEAPLPVDLKVIQRRVRAHTRDEKAAVSTVLEEFFELTEDGYHQHRCDEEIARYGVRMADKEVGKEGAKERQRRARERRKQLFELLRGHGTVPSYNATTADLEDMLSRVTSGEASRDATQPVTRDDTATHTPDTKHQTPVIPTGVGIASAHPSPGEVCRAMKGAGVADVNPSNPKLIALIAAGITLGEFVAAAEAAVQKQAGMAYALATAENRRRDAAKVGTLPQQSGPTETPYQRSMREKVAEWAPALAKRPPGAPAASPTTIEAEVRDVTPHRLG